VFAYLATIRSRSAAINPDTNSEISDGQGQFIDIRGRYREYPLDQPSLHLVQLTLHRVKARLVGVIAFCLAGEFEEFGAYQAGADRYRSATGC